MNGKTIAWEDGTYSVDDPRTALRDRSIRGYTGVRAGIEYATFSGSKITSRGSSIRREYATLKQSTPQVNLMEACLSLIRSNDLREDCYIRPLIFVGFSGINLGFINYPTEAAIVVFPLQALFFQTGARRVHFFVDSACTTR